MLIRSPIGHARHGWRALSRACFATLAMAMASHAHAGVVIQGTRVVYPANEREVVVRMTNERAYPVLVEAWIDHPEEASTTQPVPFALTPPLFRLDAAKGQTLRIFQSPGAVPTDREVLYYLNVRDIPPKADEGEDAHVAVAFRSRIKLFHRPAKLAMPPQDAPRALRWHPAGADAVRVHNPTPYFVTVTALEPEGGKEQVLTGVMVAPFSDLLIPLDAGNSLQAARRFHYTILNDLGGAVRLPGTVGASP